MDLGLTDRAYIVTGASSGLGRATAEQLLAEGARLLVCSRDKSRSWTSSPPRPTPEASW